MGLKGFDFSLTHSGVSEASQGQVEEGSSRYLILSDGISPEDGTWPGTPSHAAALLVDQALREALDQLGEPITEATLEEAFGHANQRVLELYGDDENGVSVSAVVLADAGDGSLLVGGVGDCRVYAVKPGSLELLFADPQNPRVDNLLSAEERHLSLHNALGVGDTMRVHSERHQQGPFERYVAVSYGVDLDTSEEQIRMLGLRPHDAETGAGALLGTKNLGAHALKLATGSYDGDVESEGVDAPSLLSNVSDSLGQRKRAVTLALSVGACVSLLLAGFLISDGNEVASSQATIMVAEAEELSEPEAGMDNTSWVAALREQVKMQHRKIEALQEELQSERSASFAASSGDESEMGTQLRASRVEVRNLQASVNALESQLNSRGNSGSSGADIVAVRDELRETSADRRRLESDVTRLNAALDQKSALLTAIKDSNSAYGEKYAQMESRLTAKLQGVSAAYEKEQQEQETLFRRQHDLASQLRRTQEERALLAKELSNIKAQSGENPTQYDALSAALEEEQRRNHVLKEELQATLTATASNDELDATRALLQEKESINTTLKKEIEELLSRVEVDRTQDRTVALHVSKLQAEKLALLDDKSSLMEKVNSLERFQELYATEKTLRERKELEFAQFVVSLKEQKRTLGQIESNRASLAKELETIRGDYEALVRGGGKVITHQRPASASSLVAAAGEALSEGPTRVHLVSKGDTLTGLSLRYYGTASRWNDIYESNLRSIPDKNQIKVGTALVIPFQ